MKVKLTRSKRLRRVAACLAVPALLLGGPQPATAWDPAITQAGLTERALLASSFHKVIVQRLGRPLGALEPLALRSQSLPVNLRQSLWDRLVALDPAGGYRPDADGVNTALGWVTAGAVLAETPPERGRHHFFEPTTKSGLDDKDGLSGTAHALRLSIDGGGSLRGLATGTTFDLTGLPSVRWLSAPENELGVPVFEASLERAVAAEEAGDREAALVRALLALGGILATLEDAGEPAHVRNDFRGAFLQRQGASGWSRGSRFEQFVSEAFGRAGVPAPRSKVERPSLEAFFSADDGNGLADRTHRRFFSEGTIPEEIPVDANTTPNDVRQAARNSLIWPQPTIGRLELRAPGRRYLMIEGRRALAYERLPEGVRFFLDDAVFADSAAALLPEVAAYAAGLVDHLFRGSAAFQFEAAGTTVKLEGLRGGKAEGVLTLFAEDARGRRTPIGTPATRTVTAGEAIAVAVPAGSRRVAVSFRGKDGAGDVLVVGEAGVRAP